MNHEGRIAPPLRPGVYLSTVSAAKVPTALDGWTAIAEAIEQLRTSSPPFEVKDSTLAHQLRWILADELEANKVSEVFWWHSRGGLCETGGIITIPWPEDLDALYVGLHEIGHVFWGHVEHFQGRAIHAGRPVYEVEFEACDWSLRKLAHYGLESKSAELRSKTYVLSCLAAFHNERLNSTTTELICPKAHIEEWLGIDYSTWKGKRVDASYFLTNFGAGMYTYMIGGERQRLRGF